MPIITPIRLNRAEIYAPPPEIDFPSLPDYPQLGGRGSLNLLRPQGGLKTFAILANGADTRLDAFASVGISGPLVSWGPTANQFLIITLDGSTPFFKATLYDSAAKTATVLTISGALAASEIAGVSSGLTYSTEQSAWYLKGGRTTSATLVYKLTLSGTTLTVDSSFDIDASFTGNANDILMTGDKTDLWFLDVSDGALKKYDLSASSMGSAQAAPATGYYTTDNTNAHFGFSNGKIYFMSSGTNGGIPLTFQEYNVSGNTWTTKTVPASLQKVDSQKIIMLCDVDDNTDVYFMTGNDVSTPGTDAHIVKWTSATNTTEIYCFPCDYLQGPGASVGPAQGSEGTELSTTTQMRGGVLDVSTGDMVWVLDAGDIRNAGTQWGRQTILDYTGSGTLIGLSSGASLFAVTAAQNGVVLNTALTYILTVDGGTARVINFGHQTTNETAVSLNILFNISLKIEIVGGLFKTTSPGRTILVNVLINS